MAPVVVELGSASGLLVPLIAVHLFVFYFGIMADVTPPVGLAAYAAAGIAKADPMKVGVTGFWFSIRTAILPFMFIFNTQLLLIGIDSILHLLLTIGSAVAASLVFVAATQGWFMTRNRWYENVALLLVAFTLFCPGFFMDMITPLYETVAPAQLMQIIEKAPVDENLRIWIERENLNGKTVKRGVLLRLGAMAPARERLESFGLRLLPNGERFDVLLVKFNSGADKAGVEAGNRIISIEQESNRPDKEWMFLPALGMVALIAFVQRRRVAIAKK